MKALRYQGYTIRSYPRRLTERGEWTIKISISWQSDGFTTVRADENELYQFTVWVAQSLPQVKDQVVDAIEQFTKRNLVKVDQ